MTKKTLLFLLYFVFSVVLYFTESQGLKVSLLAAVIYSATYFKNINQFLVYMCVSVVSHGIESQALYLAATLPLYISRSAFKSISRHLLPLSIIAGLAGISFILGRDSQLTTMLVFLSSVVVFVQVIDSKITHEEFFDYAGLAAAILITILGLNAMSGTLQLRYGRISINDNIRQVANLASIPAFCSWTMVMLSGKRKILYFLVGIASSFVLLLTISKGALAATAGGLMVVYLFSTRKFSTGHLVSIALAALAILAVYMYVQTMEGYHFDRLNDEYDGFSGRTKIWSLYLDNFKENTSTILFGFGPGDLKRLMISEYYAHSLFFDMFMCYGVAMVLAWIAVFASTLRLIAKAWDVFAMGLLLFTVLLYATHGNVTAPMFYVQLGVAISFAKLQKSFSYGKH